MNTKLKYIFLLCFFPVFLFSQSFENAWSGHFSYYNSVDIAVGNDKIYVASENAMFIYDPVMQDIEKVATVNGLSGETISVIHYSENSSKIFIGYTNGLIEVYDTTTGDIVTVIDIVEKQTIPANAKSINHFMEYNDLLYISCGFGISTFNVNALEFGDSFFIGDGGAQINVRQTALYEGQIYAATNMGIRSAAIANENLIDFNEWSSINLTDWIGIQSFGSELHAIRNDNRLHTYDGAGFIEAIAFPATITDFKASEDHLIVTAQNSVYLYDTDLNEIANITDFAAYTPVRYNAAITHNDAVYLGTTEYGMLQTQLSNLTLAEEIHPQGPLLNNAFAIKALPGGKLWMTFGDYDVFLNPYPLDNRGISYLSDNVWNHISYEDAFEAKSMVYITPNPANTDQVFVSSFFSGLLQIDNGVPTLLYNETNSGLESLDIGDPTYIDIRIGGTAYDRDGNLWVLNSRIENALKVYTSGGQWDSYDITDIILDPFNDDLGFREIVIDRNGYKFFASSAHGLMGFYENNGGPPILKNSTEEANNLPSNYISALAIDKDDELWIGTLRGLRVLYSTDNFFSGNPTAEAIIVLDDGIPSELLFNQFITDIFIDGSNNKWVATADSGVFYLSPDGSETIHHFTKENSPLPSNSVNQVEVDGETGRVYFATSKGAVSFIGNAREPRENLENVYAYPNPVRPGYSGDVTITGLVRDANVKITDIEGNLVYEAVSEGGSIQWNLTAFNRHKVASGVYMVLISDEDAIETTVSKIMVIR